MASCILFHGPGAQQAALAHAHSIGNLIAPPFGEDGLKVKDARAIVAAMLEGSISFRVQVVVVGPMDEANEKASDVLLKSLEEYRDDVVQPLLWAYDLGGVSQTIRSRCLVQWCPKKGPEVDNDDVMGAAWELMGLVKDGECGLIPETVKRVSKNLPSLVAALSEVLGQNPDERAMVVWERLRPLTRWKNPRPAEIVTALVEAARG